MKLKTLTVLLIVALSSCNSAVTDKMKITNASDSESIPVHLTGKENTERRVVEYKVVTGKSIGVGNIQGAINQLQEQLKEAIHMGWQPQGGIAVSVDKNSGYTCSQAIVLIK